MVKCITLMMRSLLRSPYGRYAVWWVTLTLSIVAMSQLSSRVRELKFENKRGTQVDVIFAT